MMGGARCGVATSTGGRQCKRANPDVGTTANDVGGPRNDDNSNEDDHADQKDAETNGGGQRRRQGAVSDGKRPPGPQEAGGQAAAGGEGAPACKEVSHSLGMRWEGRAAAGSLSGPPTFVYNLFRIFNVFTLYLMNITLSRKFSNHREQAMQKKRSKKL